MILIKTFLNLMFTFNYCASGWWWVHRVAILLFMHVAVHCTSEWSECMDTKAILVYDVKAYRGNGGVAPCLLKLDIILDSPTHQLLYSLERSPSYPLKRKLLWHPEPVWTFWRRKNLLPLPGLELQTIHPLTCSLHWLR